MPSSSKKQRIREAIVAILDTNAAIVALTSRANGNVVAWSDLADTVKPCIAYLVVALTKVDGSADQRRAVVQFTAVAEQESTANELIAAVDAALTTLAFAALASPLAAIRLPLEESERSHLFDFDADVERADLDAVLHITF